MSSSDRRAEFAEARPEVEAETEADPDGDAGRAERSLGVLVASALTSEGLLPPPGTRGGATLNDYVDTEALEALFSPRLDGGPRASGRVVFDCEGATVTVHSDGWVAIRDADADGDADAADGSRA